MVGFTHRDAARYMAIEGGGCSEMQFPGINPSSCYMRCDTPGFVTGSHVPLEQGSLLLSSPRMPSRLISSHRLRNSGPRSIRGDVHAYQRSTASIDSATWTSRPYLVGTRLMSGLGSLRLGHDRPLGAGRPKRAEWSATLAQRLQKVLKARVETLEDGGGGR